MNQSLLFTNPRLVVKLTAEIGRTEKKEALTKLQILLNDNFGINLDKGTIEKILKLLIQFFGLLLEIVQVIAVIRYGSLTIYCRAISPAESKDQTALLYQGLL